MLHPERRHYTPREPPQEPVVTACVYEVDRLGTTTECGLALADGVELNTLFCPAHDLDVDAGRISWETYRPYRDRYQT